MELDFWVSSYPRTVGMEGGRVARYHRRLAHAQDGWICQFLLAVYTEVRQGHGTSLECDTQIRIRSGPVTRS